MKPSLQLNLRTITLQIDECKAVRYLLERFASIGRVSTSLAETLLIQLNQLSELTLHLNFIKKISWYVVPTRTKNSSAYNYKIPYTNEHRPIERAEIFTTPTLTHQGDLSCI